MALVGHISGSKQSNSVIGISGSVIVANRPNATFPAMPGSDVKFYVEQLGLFGTQGLVSSGSLAVKDVSGVSKFSVASATGNTSVGGTLTSTGVADLNSGLFVNGFSGLSGSLALQGPASLASTLTTTGVSNLNGGLYVAGATGLSSSLAVAGTLTTTGVSNLNGGLYVAGATGLSSSLAVAGAAAMASTLDVTGNFAVNTTKFTVTAATGAVSGSGTAAFGPTAANGSLTVTATGGTGNGTFAGDVAVNGGDLTTTAASATLFNTGATQLAIGSAATAILMGAATGTTTVNNSLIVTKDLTVNGTMTTVNTTNLEVNDSVIGLGFASGTIANIAGDRGWIGGLAGTNNVMSKWDNTASEFAFATTTSSATGSFGIAAYSNLHAANIQGSIISASLGFSGSLTKLIDGTSAFVAGTNVTITSASNGAVTISATSSGAPTNAQYLVLSNDATLTAERALVASTGLTAADGGANGNYTLAIDDSVVATVSGTTFRGTIKPSQNNFYDLGATGTRWYRGYIDQISGSHTKLIDGTSAFIAGTGISIVTGSNGAITLSTVGGGGDVFGPASSTGDAIALFDGTTGKLLRNSSLTTADNGASLFVNSNLYVSGSTTFGDATSDTVSFTARIATDVLPTGDAVQNLGSPDNRWANVYTGDLHLRNDRGDYTLIEEEECLTIRFNKTGKRYKFLLEAVPELDESPVLKF